MKIGVMKPYFLPYIGYWQLLNTIDEFAVYDNVQFIKNGLINRNRILLNTKNFFIKIPLKSSSYSPDICKRSIPDQYFDKHANNFPEQSDMLIEKHYISTR